MHYAPWSVVHPISSSRLTEFHDPDKTTAISPPSSPDARGRSRCRFNQRPSPSFLQVMLSWRFVQQLGWSSYPSLSDNSTVLSTRNDEATFMRIFVLGVYHHPVCQRPDLHKASISAGGVGSFASLQAMLSR